MTERKHQVWSLTSGPRAAIVALAIVFALTVAAAPASQAQTYTVIHNFTGGGDGASPFAGLRMDTAGNLYGTANSGGPNNVGTVFKLRHYGSGWVLTTLYSFGEVMYDGANPEARVSIAQDGTLYGTTRTGESEVGSVFHLRPSASAPKSALAPWRETVLYSFSLSGSDGQEPEGDLLFDSGNIYGTTFTGGINNNGVVYELMPSGGGWTESVVYAARNNGDGMEPRGGVVRDGAGNLYGVFAFGGPHNYGAVYELTPSGSGWTEQTVYGFTFGSDGGFPFGGLIMDSSGNLYGTTSSGGSGGGGTVFELTPANGAWTFNTLYSFSGGGNYSGPRDKLVMDAAGNLYGTTFSTGAYQAGSVFELSPSNGGWTFASLHDFDFLDGYNPVCSLIFDQNGNLYGTTSLGGTGTGCNGGGCGVVFEITP